MTISNTERLRRFYSQFSGDDNVLIIINADPDAIASAMAVKRLLWRKVFSVTISNINEIKRPDNIAMIRLLGLNLVPIQKIDPTLFSNFVIVDSQPDHNELFAAFIPDVIIDHHPDSGIKAPFVDIRPNYGATATIMTEYLRAAKIKPSTKLASGLFYAIKTDTDNFVRKTLIEDVRAFQFLYLHANVHLVHKIERAELKKEFLKFFHKAISDRYIRKDRIFAYIGSVDNPDICVLIADFFMKISSVNWSIVSGIYQTKLILIFRNDGMRRNAGKVAEESFGQMGSAGGHKSAARAEIPLSAIEDVVDYRNEKKLIRWIIKKIEKRAGGK